MCAASTRLLQLAGHNPAHLNEALQGSAIRAEFDYASASITDEYQRLVYKATILDTEGYYAARDLLLMQGRALDRLLDNSDQAGKK